MVDTTANPFADEFDVEDIFSPSAGNWPYSEPKTVTLNGVLVQANEVRYTIYNDAGKRVEFSEAQELDKDNLPAGYEVAPQIDLVQNMVVDDRALPEPQYPPTVKLGDANGVQINEDGTMFRFVKRDGTPRMANSQSGFAEWIRALATHNPGFSARLAVVKADPERWFSTAMFDGLTFVMGVATLGTGQYKRNTAWPIAQAEGAVAAAPAAPAAPIPAAAADTDDTPFSVAAIAAQASSGTEYRDLLLKAGSGDSKLITAALADPDAAWAAAKAS